MSLKDRFAALRSLPLLFHLLWVTSPGLTVANVLLRLVGAGVPLGLVEAVEVYRNLAETPAEFRHSGRSSGCGTVVIWTQAAGARRPGND